MQNIKPTHLADQEHYIRHYICHCKKPFKYNCHELSSRLQFMNKMMSLFPGANNTPPFTHQDLKNIYFKMMPVEWQHAFINNGQDIASHNYTLLNLQQYMGTQETFAVLSHKHAVLIITNPAIRTKMKTLQTTAIELKKTTTDHIVSASDRRIPTTETHDTSNIRHTTITPQPTTTKPHQTTKDNSQNATAIPDIHTFPLLSHHRIAQLHNVQMICTMPTTTTNTHMQTKTNSIMIIMTSTTPTITTITKTPTTNP